MPERIKRPEEIMADDPHREAEDYPTMPRCQGWVGPRRGEARDECPREAAWWMDPSHKWALCDEHKRATETRMDANDASTCAEILGEWLKVARSWNLDGLERLVQRARDDAREEEVRAEAAAEYAERMARSAPAGEGASLSAEQEAHLEALVDRASAITDAYTALEDLPKGQMPDELRARAQAALLERSDALEAEASRYKRELGLGD